MKQVKLQMVKPVLGSQYFLYFGVMGMVLPYFNLYCYHIGFSGFQIGTLSSLRSLVVVVLALAWGTVADRFQIRKPVYILCNFASATVWALYLLTDDFYLMLMITLLYSVFYGPIISFLEAYTMDALEQEKKSYGSVRVWGSVSFVLTVVIVGKLIDVYSARIILWLILAGALLQAMIALKIPGHLPSADPKPCRSFRVFTKKRVVVFLCSAFLMLVSHGTYYGFFSIHLENLGFGSTFIGMSWAVASIAEIVVMMNSTWLFRKYSLEKVLMGSFAGAAVRWMLLAVSTSAGVIVFSQLLHAVTFAAFHVASILYIDRLSPRENKTFGQAVNNSVTYGLGMAVGFLLNGMLFERIGAVLLFGVSSGIALCAGLLFGCFRLARFRRWQRMSVKNRARG